jgi:hypothetical protein
MLIASPGLAFLCLQDFANKKTNIRPGPGKHDVSRETNIDFLKIDVHKN